MATDHDCDCEAERCRELAFEMMYRELTGAGEARARAVFMHVGYRDGGDGFVGSGKRAVTVRTRRGEN